MLESASCVTRGCRTTLAVSPPRILQSATSSADVVTFRESSRRAESTELVSSFDSEQASRLMPFSDVVATFMTKEVRQVETTSPYANIVNNLTFKVFEL